ncbi:MAG: glycerol-3-phosphate 1-O-acyltransferase PlsY [Burkholderiaceae bacterium]|nr:glycerol-3-phosphate 1-O-acyltransferase PlsY [Burkholderiaceae bacterium]MCD8516781.1 glycerol-3-phosphate 1-O-acyltransferase PlsY [Burkholderiaceae bacterium]MCD8564390.1 glycerol-3-phosphate 1-O-acyltransferase PlsY [Burkholderiaceae bacterium]
MQSIDSGFTVLAVFAVLGYLLGSVPFAVVTSRLMGLADPRTYGSGNPGATNVLRTGNKKAAILTLLGDAAKGWLAVWLANRFSGQADVIAITALAVFLGHLFPIFLGFKGGKGVATALGVLLAVEPMLGIATLLSWLIIAFFFRMSSLAAIASALFAPFYYFILSGVLWPLSAQILTSLTLISLTLIWRHRANIGRILNGTEPKIGKKSGQ